MKTWLLLLLGILSFSTKSYASFLAQPYAGYEFGTFKTSFASGTSDSATSTGTVLGARLGLQIPIFYAALDGSIYSGKHKSSNSNLYVDGDASRTSVGFQLGAKLVLLHAYAGYYFVDDYKVKDTLTSTDYTYKCDAVKLGLGIKPFPFLLANVEYTVHTPKKVIIGSTEYDISTQYTKVEYNAVMVGLTLDLL